MNPTAVDIREIATPAEIMELPAYTILIDLEHPAVHYTVIQTSFAHGPHLLYVGPGGNTHRIAFEDLKAPAPVTKYMVISPVTAE